MATFAVIVLFMNVEVAAEAMQSLGQTVRLELYRLLVVAGPQGLNVGALQEQLEIPRSTVSHHLQKLIQQNLVYQTREGNNFICHANYGAMEALIRFLTDECCQGSASTSCLNTSTYSLKESSCK